MNKRIAKMSEEVKLEKQKELYMLVNKICDTEGLFTRIGLATEIYRLLMELGTLSPDLMKKFMTDQELAVNDNHL